jgi:hypothetical protein
VPIVFRILGNLGWGNSVLHETDCSEKAGEWWGNAEDWGWYFINALGVRGPVDLDEMLSCQRPGIGNKNTQVKHGEGTRESEG